MSPPGSEVAGATGHAATGTAAELPGRCSRQPALPVVRPNSAVPSWSGRRLRPLGVACLLGACGCSLLLDLEPVPRPLEPMSGTSTDETAAPDGGTAGRPPDSVPASPPGAPFQNPEILPDLNSMPGADRSPAVSADQLEMFFASSRPGGPGLHDIYRSLRPSVTAPWGPPQLILELSTPAEEVTIELSRDGRAIYFASDRPGGAGAFDIWWAERPARGMTWSPPAPVSPVNTPSNELHPALNSAQTELFLSLQKPGEPFEIGVARRASPAEPWGQPTLVPELNSPIDEACATLGSQDRYFVFCSLRPGGTGAWDLYWSWRAGPGQPFSPPEALVELNTGGDDIDPRISEDLSTLWFSVGSGAENDLVRATRPPAAR